MYKFITASILLLLSTISHAELILTNGDSFSASFNLVSDGNYYKLTDNFWEVNVPIIDEDNHPFEPPSGNTSFVTLTLYENTNFTDEIFTLTQDTRNWLGDYGVYFYGDSGFFSDFDGSLTVSYTGPGEARFIDNITVANFAGTDAPSNVAYTSITPIAQELPPNPVPAPAGFMLLGTSLIAYRKLRKK